MLGPQVGWLPTTTIATSEALAAFTAAPASSSGAWLTVTPGPTASRIPWRGVVAWGGVPPYQSQWTLSALGPMTATDFSAPLRSGSAPPSFFSSTIDSSAIVFEMARCSGLSHGAGPS